MTTSALYLSLIIGMLASGLCVLAQRRLLSQFEIIACLAGGALGGVFAAYLVGPVMVLSRNDMAAVGAAIRYFGGFGAFAEYGDMLETQSAMVARDLAGVLESMQGGRA